MCSSDLMFMAEGGAVNDHVPYYAEGGMLQHPASAQPQGSALGRYQVMPNIQSRDRILTALAPGEIVIPADVARVKGQEFFDKLIAKHHRPGS